MGTSGSVAIVLIEDSPSDACLIEAMLAERFGPGAPYRWARTLREGLAAVDELQPACVLADLGLPDSDGFETVDALLAHAPDLPVVVVTGLSDERAGEQAVGRGAQDYLVKDALTPELLVRTIRYATERKQVELAARRREARLRSLLDVAPDAVIACDADRLITFWNRGAEATYGWSSEEAIGRDLRDLVADGEPGRDANLRHLVHDGSWEGEIRHRRKDGRSIVVDARWVTLADDQGRPIGLIGANRDVTARKAIEDELTESRARLVEDVARRRRAEEAVRRTEARLAAILATLPVGVVVARPSGEIAYLNDAARRLGSVLQPDGRLAAAPMLRYGTNDPCAAADHPLARALRGESGTVTDLDVVVGSRRIPLRASFAPITDLGGDIEYGVVVVDDISDERVAEEQLARSNAELQQFAYVASHDLSEPLRTVAGFVELLGDRYAGQLDDDADEFIGFALDGVRRMQQLIKDLLTYSRVSRLEYVLTEVATATLVDGVVDSLDADDRVRVVDPLPVVQADAGQLGRVFQNLISNGLKFVPPEQRALVEVSARPAGAHWEFSVADNGIGIPDGQRDRVFQMFQRLHSQDDYTGTGIGLAVCKCIVERHGGRIWIESGRDVGTTVRFTLPAQAGA